MKHLICTISGLVILALATLSWAGQTAKDPAPSRTYFSITPALICPFSVKTTSPILSPAKTRTQWGKGISGAMGYRINHLRMEGELLYAQSNADDIRFATGGGDLSGYYKMWGGSINAYYDIPTTHKLCPYIGAGLGVTRFSAQEIALGTFPPTTGATTVLTYRIMAGVTYPLTRTLTIQAGYRLTGMGHQDYITGGTPLTGASLKIHAILVGVQYHF